MQWMQILAGVMLAVFASPALRAAPLSQPDELALQELLKTAQYERLEGVLDRYQAAYRRGEISDNLVHQAFKAFWTSDPETGKALDAWVAARADRYQPFLARAYYHTYLGWLSRGGRWASETRPARFQAMRGRFEDALKDISTALEHHARLTIAYALAIDIAKAIGNRADVERYYRSAKSVDPYSYQVHYELLYASQRRWGGSQEAVRRIVGYISKNLRHNTALDPLLGFTAYARGRDLVTAGEHEAAIEAYSRAIELGEITLYLEARGRAYRYMDRYDKAIADHLRALELQPQWVSTLESLADTCREAGQMDRALELYEKVLELDPLQPDALQGRARLLLERDHYEAAARDYEASLTYEPYEPSSHYYLGWLRLYKLEDPAGAARALEKATDLDPDTPYHWYHYAAALHRQHDCKIMGALRRYQELCESTDCKPKRVRWASRVEQGFRSRGLCQ